MMTLGIDTQFKHILFKIPFNGFTINMGTFFLPLLKNFLNIPYTIQHNKQQIRGYDNQILTLDIFEPKGQNTPLPLLLYIHGGGFAYPAAPYHYKLAMIYAEKLNCKVVFPNYHLLLNYPFPAAYEDICCTYEWIIENAQSLNINPERIAVGGDSAGATLTANLCNLYSFNKKVKPCFQMLIYPATDYTMHTESMKKYTDTPLWNAKNTVKVWQLYLRNCSAPMKHLASPLFNDMPSNLPATYIETADIDCLRDEGLLYAQKLIDRGVNVELHKTKGTLHGFDMSLNCKITQHYIHHRINELKKAFFLLTSHI